MRIMILEKGENTNKCVTRTGNKDQGRVDAGGRNDVIC